MNYAQLKASVANWINRTDINADIETIVDLAEAEIRRDVRVMAMEAFTTGTLTGGTLALPANFLESRQLLIGSTPYEYVTPERYQIEVSLSSSLKMYTRIGMSLYVLGGGTSAYSLLSYGAFAALAADGDTNWLLTNAPDVYLWQCLKQAGIYVKDQAAAEGYAGLYTAAKDALNGTDKAARISGPLTIRPRTTA